MKKSGLSKTNKDAYEYQLDKHFGHSHSHVHVSDLPLAIGLNLGFSIAEFFLGMFLGSAAVSADAIHDLGDAILLTFTLVLSKFSNKKPTSIMSYGYKRLSVLGAVLNSFVMLSLSYMMARDLYYEFINPHNHANMNVPGLMVVSVIGILVNLFAALRLHGSKNILDKTVSLHLFEDLFGWVLTLLTSILISFSGLTILDRIASLFILLFISCGAIMNAWSALKILLQRVPNARDLNKIKKNILAIDGVISIKNKHFWSFDGEEHVFTAQIVVHNPSKNVEIRRKISSFLPDFQIVDSTIEFLEK